ncbi:MAG: lipopolysaccharide kinase InaA family protein [Candidatus Berkiella sp.]
MTAYRVIDNHTLELVVLKSYRNMANAQKELNALKAFNKKCGIGEYSDDKIHKVFIFEPLEPGNGLALFFKKIAADIKNTEIPGDEKLTQFTKAMHVFLLAQQQLKNLHDKGIIHQDCNFDNFLHDEVSNEVHLIDFDKSIQCFPLENVRQFPGTINLSPNEIHSLLKDYKMLILDLVSGHRGGFLLAEQSLDNLPFSVQFLANEYRQYLEDFSKKLEQGDKSFAFYDAMTKELFLKTECFVGQLKTLKSIFLLKPQEQTVLQASVGDECDLDFLDMLPSVPTHKENIPPQQVVLKEVSVNLEENPTRKPKFGL